jgi:hypothetical protein
MLSRALNGKHEGKRPLSLCEGGRITLKCISIMIHILVVASHTVHFDPVSLVHALGQSSDL